MRQSRNEFESRWANSEKQQGMQGLQTQILKTLGDDHST